MYALATAGILAAVLAPFGPSHLPGAAPWVDTAARKAAVGLLVALANGLRVVSPDRRRPAAAPE